MRFVVESGRTIGPDHHEPADRDALQRLCDPLAEELVRISECEADVAINLGTGEVDFFIVVDGAGPEDALVRADAIVAAALEASGIDEPVWDKNHRRADPVPA